MNVQEIKKRFEEAYVEDFGDYEIVHIDKKDIEWLLTQVGYLSGMVQKLKAGVWLVANAELREENQKLKETNFKLLGRLSTTSDYVQKLEKKIHKLEK
jgi:hypothetical protein